MHVADLVKTPEPGVVVEVVGGRARSSRTSSNTVATSPSNPAPASAAPDWYFAAGTTVKGSEHYLALFNPFGDGRHR